MDKLTQKKAVLAYLENHTGITSKKAMEELGIYRLGARIFELKQEGHPIKSGFVEVPTRTGETTRVKLYWIQGKPKELFK